MPGLDRVGNGEAEYLMLVKTRPNKQFGVSRELRRRIKECFEKNGVQAGGAGTRLRDGSRNGEGLVEICAICDSYFWQRGQ